MDQGQPIYYFTTPTGRPRSVALGISVGQGKRHMVGVVDLQTFCENRDLLPFLATHYRKFDTIEREGRVGLICRIYVEEPGLEYYIEPIESRGNPFVRRFLEPYLTEPPEPLVQLTMPDYRTWRLRFLADRHSPRPGPSCSG